MTQQTGMALKTNSSILKGNCSQFNPVAAAVRHLVDSFGSRLPDLHNIIIFTPDNSLAPFVRQQLFRTLSDSKTNAILPPWIGTLKQWATQHINVDQQGKKVISSQERQIMFIESLEQYPSLFKSENKWQVTQAILALFDEINLHNININKSFSDWLERIQTAYNITQPLAQLHKEANIVHTLWHAWHNLLDENHYFDSTTAYTYSLSAISSNVDEYISGDFHAYAIASELFLPCEKSFLDILKNKEKLNEFTLSNSPGHDPDDIKFFINSVFSYQETPLLKRANSLKTKMALEQVPFNIYFANDNENEARIIDLQVRKWLLEGKNNIGIISEDRKLSRRLRALLERAEVPIQDISGWSLATTSAAAALERWLECIEEDFNFKPMLDLLKSQFYSSKDTRPDHLGNVYRLERDIIIHENVEHGLDRYRQHLKYRSNKLHNWPQNSYQNIYNLLDQLGAASSRLTKLYKNNKTLKVSDYIKTLIDSLKELGLYNSLNNDSAGQLIIQSIQSMLASLNESDPALSWHDFRTWLGMTLENQFFSPHFDSSSVKLMTLEQSACKQFDALIFAASDSQNLPGKPAYSPFFNQSTRTALGLDTWESQRNKRLTIFKQLLVSAPDVLITCQNESKGERIPVSPWIKILLQFYELCFETTIENTELASLLECNPGITPASPVLPRPARQPSPSIPQSLIPTRLSASAHQRLINCPYQFFSSDVLKLKATEEISEELKKSDYGERIHLILQAFHQQVSNLPPPFTNPVTQNNRGDAIEHLDNLSGLIFKRDLEDNALHRSWLHRWKTHIPAYIDWQIERQQQWQIDKTEQQIEININNAQTLYGRLDRIDSSGNEKSIIDYKTGSSAHQLDVDSGEEIQLVSYALLEEKATEVSYLSLDGSDGKVKTGANLNGEHLNNLKNAVNHRLETMLTMINNGSSLNAWGDDQVCKFCDFSGLCRQQNWKSGRKA